MATWHPLRAEGRSHNVYCLHPPDIKNCHAAVYIGIKEECKVPDVTAFSKKRLPKRDLTIDAIKISDPEEDR